MNATNTPNATNADDHTTAGTAANATSDADNAAPETDGLKPMTARNARLTVIGAAVAAVVVVLVLGFVVSWGLAAIFVIIMVPGAISMAIIARHPEKTGGRSMFGVSNPNTLLEPFTTKRPR